MVLITQEQILGPVFTMPVDIMLSAPSGDTIVSAWVDESPETLTIAFPGAGTDTFGFDPNDWILKLVRFEPGIAEHEVRVTRRSSESRVRAHPNPFATTCRLTIWPGKKSGLKTGNELLIYDLAGRLVRSFSLDEYPRSEGSAVASSRYDLVWDGRDESGRLLPSGVYFYGVGAGRSRCEGKLILLR
jgi:hypothetical protein